MPRFLGLNNGDFLGRSFVLCFVRATDCCTAYYYRKLYQALDFIHNVISSENKSAELEEQAISVYERLDKGGQYSPAERSTHAPDD